MPVRRRLRRGPSRAARTPATPGLFRTRWVTYRDLPTIVRHRRRMWADIGGRTRAQLDAADPVYRAWVRRESRARRWLGIVVEDRSGRLAGSGALWLQPSQPRPGPLAGRPVPYILSMYTEPAFRGQGVASLVVRTLVSWAEDRGYRRVALHASEMGRPVYRRLGFIPGNEMKIDLPRRPPRRGSRRRGPRR